MKINSDRTLVNKKAIAPVNKSYSHKKAIAPVNKSYSCKTAIAPCKQIVLS
ncbi:MAG TPA: hypothetical protein VK203_24315 [Nostocaceae cyanobacterium]|nr:hypothetical protein [Nostocaceae cyanobacterium]